MSSQIVINKSSAPSICPDCRTKNSFVEVSGWVCRSCHHFIKNAHIELATIREQLHQAQNDLDDKNRAIDEAEEKLKQEIEESKNIRRDYESIKARFDEKCKELTDVKGVLYYTQSELEKFRVNQEKYAEMYHELETFLNFIKS